MHVLGQPSLMPDEGCMQIRREAMIKAGAIGSHPTGRWNWEIVIGSSHFPLRFLRAPNWAELWWRYGAATASSMQQRQFPILRAVATAGQMTRSVDAMYLGFILFWRWDTVRLFAPNSISPRNDSIVLLLGSGIHLVWQCCLLKCSSTISYGCVSWSMRDNWVTTQGFARVRTGLFMFLSIVFYDYCTMKDVSFCRPWSCSSKISCLWFPCRFLNFVCENRWFSGLGNPGFWGSQGRGAYINGRYVANATKGSGKGRGQENVLTTRWSPPWDVLVTDRKSVV